LSFGSIITDFFRNKVWTNGQPESLSIIFFITRTGPRANPNPLSFYISFGCTYKTHPIAFTKMYGFVDDVVLIGESREELNEMLET
jgi:hypothetical protein